MVASLHLKTIRELRALLDEGKITAPQLVAYFQERIEKIDPVIHSYITVNESAMA